MSQPELPVAVHVGEITIGGVTIRSAVLDDGRRVLDPDDVGALFQSWEGGNALTLEDAQKLAAFIKGGPL